MAEFDFGGGGGGGGTLKKLGKNKMFLMLALGVGVIGVIVMMKRQSTASSSQVTEGEAEGYPNAYNTVDTVAQMQNMQSILAGQQESMFNQFIADYQQDITQIQTDIGEATKEQVDEKINAYKKEQEAVKNSRIGLLTTGHFKTEDEAMKVAGVIQFKNGGQNTQVIKDGKEWKVQANFADSNRANEIADRLKQQKVLNVAYAGSVKK